MKIDSTEFGSIIVDGTTFPHDILIRLSGEVVKRNLGGTWQVRKSTLKALRWS